MGCESSDVPMLGCCPDSSGQVKCADLEEEQPSRIAVDFGLITCGSFFNIGGCFSHRSGVDEMVSEVIFDYDGGCVWLDKENFAKVVTDESNNAYKIGICGEGGQGRTWPLQYGPQFSGIRGSRPFRGEFTWRLNFHCRNSNEVNSIAYWEKEGDSVLGVYNRAPIAFGNISSITGPEQITVYLPEELP